jgi:hypothetical protein
MALWTGLLIRWWEQRKSLLRLVLFMLDAGLNLGRDINLLVLWPCRICILFRARYGDLGHKTVWTSTANDNCCLR